jgi:D-3-phosphoglycerate dehydrogenase / 2-oxoglutarate reductase
MPFKLVSTCNIPYAVDEGVYDGATDVQYVNQPCHTEDEIIAAAGDASAVVVGHEPYTRKVINGLKSCRLMATPKTGYDNIDVAAATEAGICVSNISGVSSEEVSDQAMALLMACARKLFREDKAVRAGQWRSIHGPEMEAIWKGILPLRGQTVGLIGFGQIPRALVPKAKGFGLNVLVYDPYISDDVSQKFGVERVELEYLLKTSDYVSLHSALTTDNRHMLGRDQIALMKPNAYLINTARGPLVDEAALYDALLNGSIAGAGLDCLEVEPARMDNPILKLDNVIVTGHSGHYSDVTAATLRERPLVDSRRIMAGQWPLGWLNPEVKEKYLARWAGK